VHRSHRPWSFALPAAFRLGALFAALLLVACSNGTDPDPTPTPAFTATATPSVLPTPRPTSTPLPTVPPAPPSGRVVTRLLVECTLGDYGLVVRVRYGSTVQGTEDPNARITRVRVYMDGVLGADSGPIWDQVYAREAFFRGRSLNLHTVQLRIDTHAAPDPADFIQFAQCPREPENPVARVYP